MREIDEFRDLGLPDVGGPATLAGVEADLASSFPMAARPNKSSNSGRGSSSRGKRPGNSSRGGGSRPPARPAPKEEDEEKAVEVEGMISAVLAGTMFRVKLASGHEVLAHISGKMRKRFIRLVVGDRVRMEMSPYDLTKARIVFRMG